MSVFKQTKGRARLTTLVAAALAVLTPIASAHAQVQTVDPDAAIDGDLNGGDTGFPAQAGAQAQSSTQGQYPAQTQYPAETQYPAQTQYPAEQQDVPEGYGTSSAGNGMPVESGSQTYQGAATATTQQADDTTYHEDDLIGAAEGVFGKGAQGLADLIKDLLKKQGEPNGYIVGREAGGAFAVGVRYGSGTLFHKVEGERPVYWTGPSIGFDAGANAASTFVLVYNLYDTDDLYKRFGAGEGQAYLIGGFNVSYLRRGDTVLIPVRAGAGLRLGANIGYMKFSEKQRWLPF